MALSLYVHIPFCLSKCLYCDFYSVPYDAALAEAYIDALAAECASHADRGHGPMRTVYVGGGTPSVLPIGLIGRLFDAIGKGFGIEGGAEVTVEANPGTLDREKARALGRMGVGRVSVGVQSFDDRELRALGRAHDADGARAAARAVREAGLDLSVDLIYGIPGQDRDGWAGTLAEACALGAAHVSAYELTPEEGTPLWESVGRGGTRMPCEDAAISMSQAAARLLEGAGLPRYEISNYARPGHECRHNLNYWLRGEYLGLGAGAHGFTGGRRRANVRDVLLYIDRIKEGISPVGSEHAVSAEEAMREEVFLGLRLMRGLDAARFKREHGLDLEGAASGLVADGLLDRVEGRIRLTERGALLCTPVTARLLEALGL